MSEYDETVEKFTVYVNSVLREISEKEAEQVAEKLRLLGWEKVVRCHDCYFADEIEGGYWCDRFDCGKEHVTPNGYCAWGERREEQ